MKLFKTRKIVINLLVVLLLSPFFINGACPPSEKNKIRDIILQIIKDWQDRLKNQNTSELSFRCDNTGNSNGSLLIQIFSSNPATSIPLVLDQSSIYCTPGITATLRAPGPPHTLWYRVSGLNLSGSYTEHSAASFIDVGKKLSCAISATGVWSYNCAVVNQ